MIFRETKLEGAYVVDIEKLEDDRGFFSRAWCKKEFNDIGLDTNLVQCNLSFNEKKGTLRGLHFQKEPFGEVKFIRCVKGSIYDVIVDLREDSTTFGEWVGYELNEINCRALYIPKGFAHGYLTLLDNSVAFYQVTEFYKKDSESGVLWSDPFINIDWPIKDSLIISEKDKTWPLLKNCRRN